MFLKRLFDIAASFIGLVLISPFLLIIALLILILMPGGSVLFIQKRAGRYGKPFRIFKFRTMVINNDLNSVTVRGDSRITPFGRILRKYKLDELPELWNVLKGDMSFVGPRPDLPEYAERLNGDEKVILRLRPGITGPATVKYADEELLLSKVQDPRIYNDEVIWPDKVSINLDYYNNRTFFGDLRIIMDTIFK